MQNVDAIFTLEESVALLMIFGVENNNKLQKPLYLNLSACSFYIYLKHPILVQWAIFIFLNVIFLKVMHVYN